MPPLGRLLLIGCFFLSGATGLVYEVVWSRYLQLIFGSTTDSVAVVLGIYMAGLGLGAAWFGRIADRGANPVRLYAWLEAGVGLFAVASPLLFDGVASAYAAVQGRFDLAPGPATALKALLSVFALGAPTLLMGGTLPALRAALGAGQGRSIGRLYAANTIGAAMGAALAGFVLIEIAGLWRTLLLAAGANLAIAALALRVARRSIREPAAPADARRWARSPVALYLGAGALLSGALAMLYEIVWARLLTLVLGPSTYAFSSVLVVYLIGLGLGGALHARTATRIRGATAFAIAQLVSAAAVTLLLPVFDSVPALALYARQLPGLGGPQFLYAQVLFPALLLLPPAVVAGYALPLCISSLEADERRAGADLGDLYLANTGGAILGTALCGFVFIPKLGTETTLRLGIALSAAFAAAGALVAGRRGTRRLLLAGGVAVVAAALAAPRWDRNVMDGSAVWREPVFRSRLDAHAFLRKAPSELLFWEEGRNATVAVRRFADGARTLYVGGKADAGDGGDMPTQVFVGVLPMLAHPDPRRVLTVGLGSGVTADRVAALGVERVDVVEMEEAVVRASVHFRDVNHDVARNRRVRLRLMDARSYLMSTRERYDLIISEPSNPWMAGVSTLFSRDHYRAARRRLEAGGLFAQWIQLYSMDAGTVRQLLATFAASFEHVQAWHMSRGDILLLGAGSPVTFSLRRMQAMIDTAPWLRNDLRALWGGRRVEDVFGHYLIGDRLIREVIGKTPDVATDDRNPIEFRAARALYGSHDSHIRRLWDMKLRAGDLLPPLRDGAVSDASVWLALARGCPHPPTALHAARRAVELRPEDPDARATLAHLLLGAKREDEAEAMLSGTGEAEPSLRLALAVARQRYADAEALLASHPALSRGSNVVLPVSARRTRGDLPGAWRAAEQVVSGLARAADRLEAAQAVVREIANLAQDSREWRRGADLLSAPGWGDAADYARLRALVECLDRSGDAARALAALAEIDRFGPLPASLLEIKQRSLLALGDAPGARAVGSWLAQAGGRGVPLWLRDP